MIVLALTAATAAFVLFALATDAHALARLGRRPGATARAFRRGVAWSLLALALVAAIVARGAYIGPVLWSGLVMAGAGIVVLACNLLPPSWRIRK